MSKTEKLLTGILAMLLLFCFMPDSTGEGTFDVERVGGIHPYADNAFRIASAESGELTIRIRDNICIYRTITQTIEPGETVIHWDGCGENQEKLYEKSYEIAVTLETDSGSVRSVSFQSPIEYPTQYLQYALPSSESLYLDHPDGWFLEFRTVTQGTVRMELIPEGKDEPVYSYNLSSKGGKIARKEFSDIAGRQRPEPGAYEACVSEVSRPDVIYRFPLHVFEKTQEKEPVGLTGEIMPERDMSESEIWEMMMKPSVVVDIDFFKHQEVYSEQDAKSRSLGTLHGQTQGLKVIRIEDGWAFIGAWNHEEAAYVEGWVPLDKLKVEYPRTEYGILIDKQRQTLSVWKDGKVIDTLLVSTGRAEAGKLYQETAAGCFLTGYHRVNFSTNGKKYDYVIQFDGGNLLHQTPYDWGQQKKDFTMGRGFLGAKASHACVRIQPEPGEGGTNAYWLFTHIPYHTRVIVLDDPLEREAVTAKLNRDEKTDSDLSYVRMAGHIPDAETEDTARVTFGGSVTAGGTRSFNLRSDSLAAFTEREGYERPLSGLSGFISGDDFTCVSLASFLAGQSGPGPEDGKVRFGPAGTEKILSASIELVRITDDQSLSSEPDLLQGTLDAAGLYAQVLVRGSTVTAEIKGHLFGFAACSEKDYLNDPAIIERLAAQMEEAGCERTVFMLGFSESSDPEHSVVHEAMAHRCVRAGADLVIGDAPGKIRGVDFIEGVPVAYSLGTLLDGSKNSRPKNGYGLLVSAEFCFTPGEEAPSVTLVPILPYGNSSPEKNDYMPTAVLSEPDRDAVLKILRRDSTDAAMQRVTFCFPGQS